MYLCQSSQKCADGSKLRHLQIAENVWDPVRKRSRVRILYNCGRTDNPKVAERLRRLAGSIPKRCPLEELAAAGTGLRVVDAWPHGDAHTLEALWHRVGLPELIGDFVDPRKFGFSVERTLFALVANRVLAPSSKRHCQDRWLTRDVRIEGCGGLELQHLQRAMDVLCGNKEALEEGLHHQLADLLNLDVEVMFHDTTSLHFEVAEEDADDPRTGSPGLRKRGHSKNGRSDAPQLLVGLAVTREGFPMRHWLFPGNTVDVATVERVKSDLKGWRLNRCVFVGDAGMVSAGNLRTLARGGGRHIVCMPARRGSEVDWEALGRRGAAVRWRTTSGSRRSPSAKANVAAATRCASTPREAERQRAHRREVLAELEAELAGLSGVADGEPHRKRVCELRASGRCRLYLRLTRGGRGAARRQVRPTQQRRYAHR